jgi:hypothetical protein
MKKYITLLIILVGLPLAQFAQEPGKQLSDARSAYSSGNLHDTRFALQQALHEINLAIGNDILKTLPNRMGDMNVIEADDNVTATNVGFAGIIVTRNYEAGENLSSSLQIISDSPLLAGINAILALPLITGGDPNQKRIRVGSYRALLQKSGDADDISWDVQIPVGSTLISFNCNGVADEKSVTDMVNTIPVDQIARFVQ